MWLSGRVHVVLDSRLSQIITRTLSMWMRQVLNCVVFNSLSSVLDQILQYQIKIILNICCEGEVVMDCVALSSEEVRMDSLALNRRLLQNDTSNFS